MKYSINHHILDSRMERIKLRENDRARKTDAC